MRAAGIKGESTMSSQRPRAVTVAAVLLAILSLLGLAFPLLQTEGVPAYALYSDVVLGLAGLVAVTGLWNALRMIALRSETTIQDRSCG
jgi:hypothetical protein